MGSTAAGELSPLSAGLARVSYTGPWNLAVLARVLETITEHRLIVAGQRVLVGLSGGPDSLALLLALRTLSRRLGCQLEAMCVDHGLRAESAAESGHVATMCMGLGIDCVVSRVDVRSYRGAHVSWQDAARLARLAALEEGAATHGCHVVALGHNAEDQAETLLFRIVRGTGLKGLAGIPYQRGVFVRPLLDVRRSAIEKFIAKRGVTPVRDPSNANRRFARARVRHEWMPLLTRENPRLVEALVGLAAEARAHPVATPLAHVFVPERHLSRAVTSQLQRAARRGGSRDFNVKGGTVHVAYGRATFDPSGAQAPSVPEAIVVPDVNERARVPWAGGALCFSVQQGVTDDDVVFDHEKIVWPLTLRSWRPGDRMRPRHGQGSRKLQDMFVDAKVPRGVRKHLPVLVDADETVLFVPHLRVAQAACPTDTTKRFLAVRAENFVISPSSLATAPR